MQAQSQLGVQFAERLCYAVAEDGAKLYIPAAAEIHIGIHSSIKREPEFTVCENACKEHWNDNGIKMSELLPLSLRMERSSTSQQQQGSK